jgi:hypothetical protein
MDPKSDRYNVQARAREKQASRVADERARKSLQKSARQLSRENEAFAGVAQSARPNLAAARSLS